MTTSIIQKSAIAFDIAALMVIYLIPTLSHLLAFPFYKFDPMRMVALGSILFLSNKKNACLLALTMPMLSYCIAGHPIAIKNIIICIELFVNVCLLDLFLHKTDKTFIAVFSSIMISKLIYYVLKYLAIYIGLLNTNIVDTNILIQIAVSLFISILFSLFFYKGKERL